jgi:hypothetical protein
MGGKERPLVEPGGFCAEPGGVHDIPGGCNGVIISWCLNQYIIDFFDPDINSP